MTTVEKWVTTDDDDLNNPMDFAEYLSETLEPSYVAGYLAGGTVEIAARAREGEAKQHRNDDRYLKSAAVLRKLKAQLIALPDDHPVLYRFTLLRAAVLLSRAGGDANSRRVTRTEVEVDYVMGYGFDRVESGGATSFLKGLADALERRFADELKRTQRK